MRRLLCASSAACLALPCSVSAQPQDEAAVVVTASRTGDIDGPAIADREAIARRQPSSLLDVLGDAPGVRAFSTGGPAGGSFVSIRGGEPNFTAVLIDGVRLNDPTNSAGGAFDFALLDPAMVDRIEIARMAGSAVHGSDALSGVVQVVTRDPARSGFGIGGQAWIDSRYGGAVSASASGGWGSGGLRVSAGYHDSGDGDPAGTLRRSQALARARGQLGSFRIDALGLDARTSGTAFPEDSGGPQLAVIRTRAAREGDLAVASVALSQDPAKAVRPTVSLQYSRGHDASDSPPIAPGVLDGVPASSAHTRFARLEAIGAVAADIGTATVSLGGALLRENGRSDGILDFGFPVPVTFARTRVTRSGFAEATLRPAAALTLNGAVRYDTLEGGEGHWTGRGGIGWRIAPGSARLVARVASGYKQPSLYALGQPLIGNSMLRPERSRSAEAGIEWPLQSGRVALTVFENRFRELIDFDAVAFRLVNREDVRASGAEAEVALRLGQGWSLAAALTRVSLDSATALRGRPRWNGNLRLHWERGRWQVAGAVRGNGAFDDSSIPTGAVVTAGHVEADAGVRYALRERASIRLSLLNLGDDRSWDAVGTPSPGRSLRLALTLE